MNDRVIISLGHRFRGDDGVGPFILDRLRNKELDCIENTGDMTRLLEDWKGRRVTLLDAVCADDRPAGEIIRLDGLAERFPASVSITSSHGLNLAEAIELGKLMDALPRELQIYAICGEQFSIGEGLSPAVEAAAERLMEEIVVSLQREAAGGWH